MKNFLIAYASKTGSTAEIAQMIAEEIQSNEIQVDVLPFKKVDNLASYDAIILGAPMMMGWHPGMVNFIQNHQTTLKNIPTAYFITAINLTDTGETQLNDVPIFIDKNFARPPRKASRLSPRERHTSITGYLDPIFADIPSIIPEKVAFFGGNLNLKMLKWWQILLVTFIIRAKPGDRRNPVAIQEWASNLPAMIN